MKRKILLSIFLIFIFYMTFSIMNLVQAASYIEQSEPEYSEALNCFFANGTDIVIQDGGEGKTLITWGTNSSLLIPTDASVFGGGHNKDGILRTSRIIMNSGTLNTIFGGGLHISQVETSNIVVNGGRVSNGISGGGAATFTSNVGERCLVEECASRYSYYSGDVKQSLTRVNNANITINDIKSAPTVYGGGEGISNTTSANVAIKGGTLGWVTAGGSNGYTGNSTLEITGGNIQVVQSVNRGEMQTANMVISGGKIENFYIGGETVDKNVNGTINEVNANITKSNNTSDYIVKDLDIGTSGGKIIGTEGNNTTNVNIRFLKGAVQKLDVGQFEKANILVYVFVTINGTRYELGMGKTLEDLPQLSTIKNVEGKEFEKFINKETEEEFNEITPISENIELIAIYKDREPEEGEIIVNKDTITNIKLESEATVLPKDTIMEVSEITQIAKYNEIKEMLPEIKNFRAFDITLKSNDVEVQPDGTVKISIPIPSDFNSSNLIVYRIEDENKIEYAVNLYEENGIQYAAFDTNHFSLYVLAEKNAEDEGPTEEELANQDGIGDDSNDHILDNEPKTGIFSAAGFSKVILLIAIIGFVISKKMKRK